MKEQVKSGFLIAGKLVAAFCIAATFMAGCALAQTAAITSQIAIGWLLIIGSIVVMATTVRFWAAGFFGFIAYGALRFLGGTLFASSLHLSALYMLSLTASLLGMGILCVRFASRKPRITRVEGTSLVISAICVLLAFPLMDSYKSVAVLNIGNVALLLSWLAGRSSPRPPHSTHAKSSHV
ncbi:MAG TPA: hypothetical protein VK788_20760 [Terriglobales bacterium]|nr:hypothetical protein [Terriglobales bacterium]